MELTNPAPISQLSEAHLEGALALSDKAGWNQVADDWQMFFSQGRVFGIIENQMPVASAAIMPYGTDFAWIGMVITHREWRGQGYGTALLKHCLTEMDAVGREVWLDATLAGEPIYRSLGFLPIAELTRWEGRGLGREPNQARVASRIRSDELTDTIAMADTAFGASRKPLLDSFYRRCPEAALVSSTRNSVGFARNGHSATQVGPVVSNDQREAADLIEDALDTLTGAVFLDVADANSIVTERLQARGFMQQRPFLRMLRGRSRKIGQPEQLVAIAGPEFG